MATESTVCCIRSMHACFCALSLVTRRAMIMRWARSLTKMALTFRKSQGYVCHRLLFLLTLGFVSALLLQCSVVIFYCWFYWRYFCCRCCSKLRRMTWIKNPRKPNRRKRLCLCQFLLPSPCLWRQTLINCKSMKSPPKRTILRSIVKTLTTVSHILLSQII